MFRRIINKIKRSIQRLKYGVSDYDLMNFDMWFLENIPKLLKRFKDNHHGVPVGYFENDYYLSVKDKLDDDTYNNLVEGKLMSIQLV